MKKILIAGLITMMSGSSFAQINQTTTNPPVTQNIVEVDDNFKSFRIGVHASPSLTTPASNSDFEERSSSLQFQWGLLGEKYFEGKNYSITGGIDFASRAGKISYTGEDNVVYRAEYKTQFLEIPVGIKMFTNPIGNNTFFLRLGIAPGFRISDKSELRFEATNTIIENDENLITPFAINFQVGGGMQINFGKGVDVFAALIYKNGLTSISRDDGHQSIPESTEFNINDFALQIGVLF